MTNLGGDWLLIATFRGSIAGVVAKGDNPSIPPGADGFQQLKRLDLPLAAISKLIKPSVEASVALGEPVRRELLLRGEGRHAYAEPVLSGTGNVHAVWVWVGVEKEPTYPHVRTGAWEWDLDELTVIYGPGIPDIYGREWTVGIPYPLHNTVDTLSEADMAAGAALVASRADGTRYPMTVRIDRPSDNSHGGSDPMSLRAATEVVKTETGCFWRGVTWDVTAFDPPGENPLHAANKLLAQEIPGWIAIVYWKIDWAHAEPGRFPILVVRWQGKKVIDGIYVDPNTGRARVHPDDRGLPHRLAEELEHRLELTATLRLWGDDDRWHTLDLALQRVKGTNPPAATVRIIRRPHDPIGAIDDSSEASP
jgi:hypothetical protein